MCTMSIDGFNGIAHHLVQNVDVAIVAAVPVRSCETIPANAGDTSCDLLGASDNTFKYDFGSEDIDGKQDSTVSIFTRESANDVRHVYTGHPILADAIGERGIDLLAAVCHVLTSPPWARRVVRLPRLRLPGYARNQSLA
jgi:predicted dithiol-disulfide oxidoreductase (DUF899 family)